MAVRLFLTERSSVHVPSAVREPPAHPAGQGTAPPADGLRGAADSPSAATTRRRSPRSCRAWASARASSTGTSPPRRSCSSRSCASAQHDLRRRQQQAVRRRGRSGPPHRARHPGVDGVAGGEPPPRSRCCSSPPSEERVRAAPAPRAGRRRGRRGQAREGRHRRRPHPRRRPDRGSAHAILGVTNQLARTFVFEKGEPPDDGGRRRASAFCLDGLVGARTRNPVVGVSLRARPRGLTWPTVESRRLKMHSRL